MSFPGVRSLPSVGPLIAKDLRQHVDTTSRGPHVTEGLFYRLKVIARMGRAALTGGSAVLGGGGGGEEGGETSK